MLVSGNVVQVASDELPIDGLDEIVDHGLIGKAGNEWWWSGWWRQCVRHGTGQSGFIVKERQDHEAVVPRLFPRQS